MPTETKITWHGHVLSVQPRIRLLRSFDQRSHSYLGYILLIHGDVDGESQEFGVALGKAAHEKQQFRVADEMSGLAEPVEDPRLETAGYYKASAIKILSRGLADFPDGPPFLGVPPSLETYRARGHRRLAARTYETSCRTCIWGCMMPVEMTVDHWNPRNKRYRFETFCYGPLSCRVYKPGPTRKVPGRKGMQWEEQDWVDQQDIGHRRHDE